MFIRTKRVKGKRYAYLVENEWKNGRSRQKVVNYLGRVFDAPTPPAPELSQGLSRAQIIEQLVAQETALLKEEVKFHKENNSFVCRRRDVVIAVNGGFLCTHTLTEIMDSLHVHEDRPGTALAHAFANAGLRIPQHAFVTFYTGGAQ